MKITNKLNLPEPVVRAVSNDSYDKGQCDFSCTELLKPSRIWALERRHRHKLEEDAADRLYALFGQLGHLVLERANSAQTELFDTRLVEKRLYRSVDVPGMKRPIIVGGQLDLGLGSGERAVVQDYKFTSIWTGLRGAKTEWHQQLNINAWLARGNAYVVEGAQVIALYRDWSKREAGFRQRTGQGDAYPSYQVEVFDIPLWPDDEVREFVAARIVSHVSAYRNALPECTPEERWQRDSKWAVVKRGNKKASKLCDTPKEAADWALSKVVKGEFKKDPDRVESEDGGVVYDLKFRPGEAIRCEDYCPVSKWCEQWKNDPQRRSASYEKPVVPRL